MLLKNKKLGVILGGAFGVTLMLWICIQFYMFPPNFMSTIYFVFGFCQAVTGYAAFVYKRQESFSFCEADYADVGRDQSKLVVYFSRTGYVKKVAYATANELGADVYEIKSTEKTSGTLGFWWCGRFGMLRRDMPIEEVKIDLSSYEEVVVCSPIWVFSLAAPVRSFLRQSAGKIKKVRYIFVHYTTARYEKTAKEADKLLGITRETLIDVRCRQGRFKPL